MPASNTAIRGPALQQPGQYPYIDFTQFRSGSFEREDSTPGSESHAKGHRGGSFEETGVDGSHRHFSVGPKHEYNQSGKTDTTELNQHSKTGGGTVSQIQGDSHSENAGSKLHAIGGDTVHVSAGMHYQHATGGNQQTSTGDLVTDHNEGSQHHNIEGDHVTFIGGTKYQQIGGEYGVFVSNGNYDLMASGNIQFTCQNFTVNAASSITLNTPYGTILINNQGITITSLQKLDIKLNAANTANVFASNEVYTMGANSGTLLQGGGTTVSPITVIG